MIVFIAAVSSAWARGLSIDCGCFGGGGQVAAGQTKYLQEILRDVGLLALAAFQGRLGENLWFGGVRLGPWLLHPLVLVYALSGSLMISKTLRIPKL